VRPTQIGSGHVAKIVLSDQDLAALEVQVEERLEVLEPVGGPQGVRRLPAQRHAVAGGEVYHQLGLDAALDVHVQVGLGQAADEFFDADHQEGPPGHASRGVSPTPVHG
jgi:hypothetical protein